MVSFKYTCMFQESAIYDVKKALNIIFKLSERLEVIKICLFSII